MPNRIQLTLAGRSYWDGSWSFFRNPRTAVCLCAACVCARAGSSCISSMVHSSDMQPGDMWGPCSYMASTAMPPGGWAAARVHLCVCRAPGGLEAERAPVSDPELACHICAQCPWVTGVHDATSLPICYETMVTIAHLWGAGCFLPHYQAWKKSFQVPEKDAW